MLNLHCLNWTYYPTSLGVAPYDFVHLDESWELMTWPDCTRHYENLLIQAVLAATGALEEF